MINHPDPEQLTVYIDGELSGSDRDDLEQHLTGCSECSATLRALRATRADLRALPSPLPSEQASWALRTAIVKARKRPARLYRVAIAASSAAAIAIAVIVITTPAHRGDRGKTTNAASAPRTLGQTNVPPPIEIDPTNYTRASATSLLATYGALRAYAGGTSAITPSAQGRSAPASVSPRGATKAATADLEAAYATAISRCERAVVPPTSGRQAIGYIVGRYEGTPAFFLIYSVVSAGMTKTEMWVVQQKDCYIRLFLAPR